MSCYQQVFIKPCIGTDTWCWYRSCASLKDWLCSEESKLGCRLVMKPSRTLSRHRGAELAALGGSEESSISTKQVCLSGRSTARPDLYDFAEQLRDAERLHQRRRTIGCRGAGVWGGVEGADGAVGAESYCKQKSLLSSQERRDSWPAPKRQKRPVTTERNLFSRERD